MPRTFALAAALTLFSLPAVADDSRPAARGYVSDGVERGSNEGEARGYLPDAPVRESDEGVAGPLAQPPRPDVLFGGHVEVGGWGGFGVEAGAVAGQPAVWVRGGGGVLIHHVLTIGLGGATLANVVPADDSVRLARASGDSAERAYIHGGFGGLLVALDLRAFSVVHPHVRAILGGAGFQYGRSPVAETSSEVGTGYRRGDGTGGFAADLAAGATLNVARWMRVDLLAGYLLTVGIDMPGLRDADVRNFHGGIQLRFGKF